MNTTMAIFPRVVEQIMFKNGGPAVPQTCPCGLSLCGLLPVCPLPWCLGVVSISVKFVFCMIFNRYLKH